MNFQTLDRLIPATLLILLIVAIVYTAYINITNPPRPDHSLDHDEDLHLVLVVNKSIAEWKNLYREYLSLVVNEYKTYGWPIDDNITELYIFIENAEPGYILIEKHTADPIGPDKYIQITFKLYIPKFAIQLLNRSNILRIDDGVNDPFIAAIVEAINKHLENTSRYGYVEFRKAYIILTMIDHGIYYSEKGPDPVHPLLALYRGYGVCSTQTYVALALLSRAGIWSALIHIKLNGPADHVRSAVHIEFPEWWKGRIPEPYIWKNMTFYAVEVSGPGFFVDKTPNSCLASIWPPVGVKINETTGCIIS